VVKVKMSEFNVEAFVARLERMGLKLTAVPLADGKLRINRWRMMQAAENTQHIQDLWASQIGDNQARIDMLGAYLAALAPPGVTANRMHVNRATTAPAPAASAPTPINRPASNAPTAPSRPAPPSPATVNRSAPGLATAATSKPGEFTSKGVVTAVQPSVALPDMKPPTSTGVIEKSFDRRWLEASGSEDSHGRTLWAVAECAGKDIDPSRRKWAASLFKIALPAVEAFRSPRAWAFSLLALDAFCTQVGEDPVANRLRGLLIERLMGALSAAASKDWVWFEDVLAYDNARLPQALIQTGVTTETPACVEAGLRSLRWLLSLQTTSSGYFRPVGTKSFGRYRRKPEAFDQQPVEASATISACLAARRADDGAEWPTGAMRAFDWFLGENDLQSALIDPDTGSCSDGLHPDRANENKGAESLLSYLLGLVEIRQSKCFAAIGRT
jgi:hypothetical protein